MSNESRQHATRLLRQVVVGDAAAADELVPLLYDELREIARRLLVSQQRATLQPTELIHEAWVRLADGEQPTVDDRQHFQRLAARAMRFVLVDRARSRVAEKRGGGARPKTLDEALVGMADGTAQVLAVHEALEALAQVDAQLAEIVELRFYGGQTMDEIAGTLGVSRRTVQRGWRLARAWWIEEYAGGAS